MFGPIWAIIKSASVLHLQVYEVSVSNKLILFGRAENLKYSIFDSTFEALFSDTVVMRGFPRYAN